MGFSTKRGLVARKSGFTLREILIIIVVISVGLLSVLVVLTDGMKYVQKTRQKVVALNLAREGMEAVYQIRDTNWTRRSGTKDSCWLKINPLIDEGDPGCSDDARFTSGFYPLQRLVAGGQEYFALTGPLLTGINLSHGIVSNSGFSLCQQSGYWNSCMYQESSTSEGKYFREIEGLGLYLKDVATTGGMGLSCTGGINIDCGTSRPKEFRFCSRVVYLGDSTGEVKLCGVMTNFKGE